MAVKYDAARMARLKCPCCGSKDKNSASVNVALPGSGSTHVMEVSCCNQCGYTMFHGLSAHAVVDLLFNRELQTRETYECLIHKQHPANHPR